MTKSFPHINQSTLDELPEHDAGWLRYVPPGCDICGREPCWRHPAGGLRCSSCPRPS